MILAGSTRLKSSSVLEGDVTAHRTCEALIASKVALPNGSFSPAPGTTLILALASFAASMVAALKSSSGPIAVTLAREP